MPSIEATSYQTIQLNYGMALDNMEVERYVIYRSTVQGFMPAASDIAGLARGLNYQDKGLLPDTTYYYRIAARDLQGNIGPLTDEVSATTGSTTLKPLIVSDMNLVYSGSAVSVTLKVRDYHTGTVLTGAKVEGRFTYSAGRYTSGITGADGNVTLSSEAVISGRQVGFEPRRIRYNGYYYASRHDLSHAKLLMQNMGHEESGEQPSEGG